VVKALTEWAQRAKLVCGGRLMRPETLHLTLAFLGDTPVSALPSLVQLMHDRPLSSALMVFNRYGAFKRQGIIWAGPQPDSAAVASLGAVYEKLWEALRHVVPVTQRVSTFCPHITLLRGASCRHLPDPPPPVAWKYNRYVLVASQPAAGEARYRILAASPLL